MLVSLLSLFYFGLSRKKYFLSTDDEINNSRFGERSIDLNFGQSFSIFFHEPFGFLVLKNWTNSIIQYSFIENSKQINTNSALNTQIISQNISSSEEGYKTLVAIDFGNTTGNVTFLATDDTHLSFLWITFPSSCTSRYFHNKNSDKVILSSSNTHSSDESTSNFCYFSSLELPVNYAINYHLSHKQVIKFITSQDDETLNEYHDLEGNASFEKSFNDLSVLVFEDMKFVDVHEYISIALKSKLSDPPYVFWGMLSDSFTLIHHISSDNSSKNTMNIILGSIGGLIILGIILFIYIQYSKRKGNRQNRYSTSQISEETVLSRPPTPEAIQIDQYQSESADGSDVYGVPKFTDEFVLPYDTDGYSQNDYNPSNIEYTVPNKSLLKTVLNEVNAKH